MTEMQEVYLHDDRSSDRTIFVAFSKLSSDNKMYNYIHTEECVVPQPLAASMIYHHLDTFE